ncbi:MAG: dockerin type I repeat-containing protein [Planctomycetota bacterium]
MDYSIRATFRLVFVSATLCGALGAQSINVNFGTTALPVDYAGVGLPGFWNVTSGAQGPVHPLMSLAGQPTSVNFTNIGGTALLTQASPAPGVDGDLMTQYLVTHNPNLEVCIFFHNLQPGTYLVIAYTWLPNASSLVSVDQAVGPDELVGGPWPGGLAEGRTHSVRVAQVTNGNLGLHSGVPPGASPVVAALNGVQLVLLPVSNPFVRGDVNGDGSRDIGDAVGTLQHLFGGVPSSCLDALDFNDDGAVDIGDAVALLANLFQGQPGPTLPSVACGPDPSLDPIGCTSTAACP